MFEDKATLITGGDIIDMIREIFQTAVFALSERPTERRRKQLKTEILKADDDRAKGIMSALNRGSVLLQLEEARTGGTGS